MRAAGYDGLEFRDVGASSNGFSVPRWMLDEAAPTATKVAPLLTHCVRPLPKALNVNLLAISTPPTGGVQSAPNASVSAASVVDGGITLPVRTYACRVLASQQLVDQGNLLDSQLIPAMTAAVDEAIETDIINADGTNGTLSGIRETASISTQTYTDTTPTLAEFCNKVETLVRDVEIGSGGTPVMLAHQRRLSWMRQRNVTEGTSLDWSAPTIPGATVSLFGGTFNVIVEPGLPTNLGSGTNEDAVIVMRGVDSIDFYASPHTIKAYADANSGTAQVAINVMRYVAFTAARLPASIGELTGSGLVAP